MKLWDRIAPLISEGKTYQQIADAVGVSRSAVAGACFRQRHGHVHALGTGTPRNVRLPAATVTEIRVLAADGWGTRRLAKRFGINRSTAWEIARGITHRHIVLPT